MFFSSMRSIFAPGANGNPVATVTAESPMKQDTAPQFKIVANPSDVLSVSARVIATAVVPTVVLFVLIAILFLL